MNWFQRLFSTPKFHAAISVVSTIAAALVPPQFQAIAMTLAGLFATNAAVLPHPVDPPAPVVLPPQLPGASYHSPQYMALAVALINALQQAGIVPVPPATTRPDPVPVVK